MVYIFILIYCYDNVGCISVCITAFKSRFNTANPDAPLVRRVFTLASVPVKQEWSLMLQVCWGLLFYSLFVNSEPFNFLGYNWTTSF